MKHWEQIADIQKKAQSVHTWVTTKFGILDTKDGEQVHANSQVIC